VTDGLTEALRLADEQILARLLAPGADSVPQPGGQAGTITPEIISETLQRVYEAPIRWHGSEDDPHLYHPDPDRFWGRYCTVCGMPRAWVSAVEVADTLPVPRDLVDMCLRQGGETAETNAFGMRKLRVKVFRSAPAPVPRMVRPSAADGCARLSWSWNVLIDPHIPATPHMFPSSPEGGSH
jgi:hypothetical protein